jgi:hypothetical protein
MRAVVMIIGVRGWAGDATTKISIKLSAPPSLYSRMLAMLHYRCIEPPKSHCKHSTVEREGGGGYQIKYYCSSLEGGGECGGPPVVMVIDIDNMNNNNNMYVVLL